MEKLLIFFSFAPFAAADRANEHPPQEPDMRLHDAGI